MTSVKASDVKALRQQTGAGMMDAKKALVEADGDHERAVELIRVRLGNKVGKLAGRETSEGTVQAHVHGDVAGLVEVDCNTDFVARNDDFVAFAGELAAHVAHSGADGAVDTAALLEEQLDGQSIEQARADLSAKTGENVVISRAERVAGGADTAIASYVHANGKIGVLVQVDGGDAARRDEFAREVAMHVAAMPGIAHVSPDDVPQDARDAELRVYEQQAEAEGKPEQIRQKMSQGRLQKWLREVALLPQEHINPDKHDGKTIDQLRKDVGDDARIVRFVRFAVGESGEQPA